MTNALTSHSSGLSCAAFSRAYIRAFTDRQVRSETSMLR
jgi:hypothetical protein